MEWDAIVVGAGLAGLSTAALLSRKGARVLVLEKSLQIGGRARVVRKQGCVVDYGIHFNRFAGEGACAEVVRAAGGEPRFAYPGKPVVWRDGRFHLFPLGPADFWRTTLLSRSSKAALVKLAASLVTTNPRRYYHKSVGEWLSDHSTDRGVEELFRIFCMAALVCPEIAKASSREARAFLARAATARESIGYMKGGWEGLFDLLGRTIAEGGKGRIATGVAVREIVVEGGVVRKVTTAKGDFEARAVVCALPFQHVPSILDLERVDAGLARYSRTVEGTAGVSIDFALSRRVSDLDGVVMTLDPPTLGAFPSNIEPSLAPSGKQLGTWLMILPPERVRDRPYARAQLRALSDLVARMFPGIRDYLEWERPLVLEMVDGAVPKVGQARDERAQLSSPIANLFFAGDSTCGRGFGGDIAFSSAIECSKLVARHLGR